MTDHPRGCGIHRNRSTHGFGRRATRSTAGNPRLIRDLQVRWGVSSEELCAIINGKQDVEQAVLDYMRTHEPVLSRSKTTGLERGNNPQTSGFGFNTDGTINRAEYDTAMRMIRMRQAGATYASIAERLNADGYTTRSGRPWRSNNVHHIANKAAARIGVNI